MNTDDDFHMPEIDEAEVITIVVIDMNMKGDKWEWDVLMDY